jgi:hypothetical protein
VPSKVDIEDCINDAKTTWVAEEASYFEEIALYARMAPEKPVDKTYQCLQFRSDYDSATCSKVYNQMQNSKVWANSPRDS